MVNFVKSQRNNKVIFVKSQRNNSIKMTSTDKGCHFYNIRLNIRQSFYFTSMLFRVLVVVDAYKKDVAGVFSNLRGIVLTLNLIEGSGDGMVD